MVARSEPSSSMFEFAALICFRRPLFKSEMWSNNTRFHSYTFVTQCTLSEIKTFCYIFGEIIQLRTKCSNVYIWILVFLDVEVMQCSRWVTTFLKNVPTQLYGVRLLKAIILILMTSITASYLVIFRTAVSVQLTVHYSLDFIAYHPFFLQWSFRHLPVTIFTPPTHTHTHTHTHTQSTEECSAQI